MTSLHFSAHHSVLVITILLLVSIGCGSSGDRGPVLEGIVNATQNALVAEYDITVVHSGASAWVEFGTDVTYGRRTSESAPTVGKYRTISVLVAGMKPNTLYHMRAHVSWAGGSWVDQDRTFTTGTLASVKLTAPELKVTRPTADLQPAPGVELFSSMLPVNPNLIQGFVTDLQGNVIWYYPGPVFPIKLLPNGHFMANVNYSDLREFDLSGNTIRDLSVAQVNRSLQSRGYSEKIIGFHHDFLALPNGHWIGLANVVKAFTDLPGFPGVTNVLGDELVDIDTAGNVTWAWSAFDHLDINRHPMGLVASGGGADWTHSNALQYAPDGNLLLSMRAQSWVIKIDYENGAGSGDVLWRLGYQGDFTLAGGDSRDWFYGQHDPVITSTNGAQTTLSLWDNGNLRVSPDGTSCNQYRYIQPLSCYSRPTIFKLNEDKKIANLVWQDLSDQYSFWGGSTEILSNENVEFALTEPFNNSVSRVEEVTQSDNPQAVWQLDMAGENAYRANRIPSLYPGVTWNQ